MGSGSYDSTRAIQEREYRRTERIETFTYQGTTPGSLEKKVHPLLDIRGRVRECVNDTPIVLALDVTRSRGEDTRIIYQDLPQLVRHLQHLPIPNPALSFCAVGDAHAGDKAPLQISQFEADNRLDEALSKVWIEEGGGGTGQESYELAAYYYARHTRLHCLRHGRKGYFFIIGDEAPYPRVHAQHVRSMLGFDEIDRDIPTELIFQELQDRFYTFLIFPQKTMAERRRDIDAEIRQRVLAAGGRHDNVDIRASLIWNDRNDLDLHVIAPSGEHICFRSKRSKCGGWLDVDQNVTGETRTPVENIQWVRGTAPAGRYLVFVQNYRYHELRVQPIEFRAELEINGKVQTTQGTISLKGETGAPSNQILWVIEYDPSDREAESSQDPYEDSVVLQQWRAVLPDSHILLVRDPHSISEVIAGVLTITSGQNSESFLNSHHPKEVRAVLEPLLSAWRAV